MPKPYGLGAKKSSYTISQSGALAAEVVAGRHANGNLSLVVDVALKYFASLPGEQIERLIAREHAERAVVGSRNAWMRAFWNWLSRLHGASGDPIDNLFAPRSWSDHTIVFLLKSATQYPDESDAFAVHAWARDIGGHEWRFSRDASPVESAERVYERISSRHTDGAVT